MLNGIKKLFSCSKYDYDCNEIKNISFSPKGLISYFSNFMKFPKCKPVLPIKGAVKEQDILPSSVGCNDKISASFHCNSFETEILVNSTQFFLNSDGFLKDESFIHGKYKFIELDELLKNHTQSLKNIYDLLPFTIYEIEELVIPTIRQVAKYIYTLPASASFHHNIEGGLLFHSIETARLSLAFLYRESIGVNELPYKRKQLQKPYALAVFLCGLLHDSGKVLTDFEVRPYKYYRYKNDNKIDKTSTGTSSLPIIDKWNPIESDLYSYLTKHNTLNFDVLYKAKRGKRHESFTQIILSHIICPKCMNYLLAYQEVMEEMFRTLNGDKSSIFYRVIKKADIASCELDLVNNIASRDEFFIHDNPINKLLSILQEKIRTDEHVFNHKNGYIFLIGKDVYLSLNTKQFYELLAPIKDAGIYLGLLNTIALYKKLVDIGIGKYSHNASGKVISTDYMILNGYIKKVNGLLISKPEYLYAQGLVVAPEKKLPIEIIEIYEERYAAKLNNQKKSSTKKSLSTKNNISISTLSPVESIGAKQMGIREVNEFGLVNDNLDLNENVNTSTSCNSSNTTNTINNINNTCVDKEDFSDDTQAKLLQISYKECLNIYIARSAIKSKYMFLNLELLIETNNNGNNALSKSESLNDLDDYEIEEMRQSIINTYHYFHELGIRTLFSANPRTYIYQNSNSNYSISIGRTYPLIYTEPYICEDSLVVRSFKHYLCWEGNENVSITLAPVFENDVYKEYLKRCTRFKLYQGQNREVSSNASEALKSKTSIKDSLNLTSSIYEEKQDNKTCLISIDNMFTPQELQEIDKVNFLVDMENEKESDSLSSSNSNSIDIDSYSLLKNNEEDVIEFENNLEALYSNEHKNDLDFENNPLRTYQKTIDDRPRDANGRYIKVEDNKKNKQSKTTNISKSNVASKTSKSSSLATKSSFTIKSPIDVELETEAPKRKRGRPKKVKPKDE
jgi:hypothetical protein